MKASIAVLALTRYGTLGASSRLRFEQYIPWLTKAGLHTQIEPLMQDTALVRRYSLGGYSLRILVYSYAARLKVMLARHSSNLIWIQKEALPWLPLSVETILLRGVPFVLDFDDAVFHNYDNHSATLVRRLFGRRFDHLMAKATLVVVGNDYLADRARQADAPWVEVVPTVIDLERYTIPWPPKALTGRSLPRVVWIGSPTTVHYLYLLRNPLRTLAQRVPFVLRVIGGGNFSLPGVDVELVPWTEATEVESIAACQVGVMPLLNSAWEQGKCGYKLIQYMACGLPVVASPVGVNNEIVQYNVNGFLAHKAEDWVSALESLLLKPELRKRMGQAGRHLVETVYCIQNTGPKMAELLKKASMIG